MHRKCADSTREIVKRFNEPLRQVEEKSKRIEIKMIIVRILMILILFQCALHYASFFYFLEIFFSPSINRISSFFPSVATATTLWWRRKKSISTVSLCNKLEQCYAIVIVSHHKNLKSVTQQTKNKLFSLLFLSF